MSNCRNLQPQTGHRPDRQMPAAAVSSTLSGAEAPGHSPHTNKARASPGCRCHHDIVCIVILTPSTFMAIMGKMTLRR